MVTKTAQKPAAPRRDRARTERTILDAVARLILRDGLSGVGINALAREAGIDKVLIYRYFGDLDGVYRAYAEHGDFWWSVDDIIGTEKAANLAGALKSGFRRHAAEMRKRPVTLAVIGAETANRTPLVIVLEEVRERRALELMDAVFARYGAPAHVDLPALTAILGAAIDYLAARARQIRVYGGVEIKTDKDWERLFTTVDAMIDGAFSTAGKPAQRKRKP